MQLSRRGFLGGLLALVAAPAIVRVESLMALPTPAKIIVPKIELLVNTAGMHVGDVVTFSGVEEAGREFVVTGVGNNHLTIDMITREAVQLFKNTNAFIQNIDRQYDHRFAAEGAKIGSSLMIRDAEKMYSYNHKPKIEFAALTPKTPWMHRA